MEDHCNFSYSLLGIETKPGYQKDMETLIAISLTPYQGLKLRDDWEERIKMALQFLLLPIRD